MYKVKMNKHFFRFSQDGGRGRKSRELLMGNNLAGKSATHFLLSAKYGMQKVQAESQCQNMLHYLLNVLL